MPVDASIESERLGGPFSGCFGQSGALADFPYLPDLSLHGTPLAGSQPLARYTSGSYAGKIRMDRAENLVHAIYNQVENVMKRLRTGPPSPTYTYVIGFDTYVIGFPGHTPAPYTSLENLRKLANDPASRSFDAKQTPGFAILTKEPQDFFPAFQRVRQELIKHAMQ
jgi:hypothetical protein